MLFQAIRIPQRNESSHKNNKALGLEVTTDKQDDAVHDSDLDYDGERDAPREHDSDGEEGTLVA